MNIIRPMHKWSKRMAIGFAFYFMNNIISELPSYSLRKMYAKMILKIEIGSNTSLHMHCFISGNRMSIGKNTVINRYVYLDGRGGLDIGDNVNISHYVIIQSLDHDPNSVTFDARARKVVIEDDVWIGARALVLPGVTIGRGSVVGAGSVVTHDVEQYTIVAGAPARIIGRRRNDIKYTSRYFPFFDSDIQ